MLQQQQQQTVQLVSGSALSPQPQSGTTQQVITLTPEQYAQLAQQQQQPGVLYYMINRIVQIRPSICSLTVGIPL